MLEHRLMWFEVVRNSNPLGRFLKVPWVFGCPHWWRCFQHWDDEAAPWTPPPPPDSPPPPRDAESSAPSPDWEGNRPVKLVLKLCVSFKEACFGTARLIRGLLYISKWSFTFSGCRKSSMKVSFKKKKKVILYLIIYLLSQSYLYVII